MDLLNLTEAPEDPIARIMWLSGVMEKVTAELDEAFSTAYFDARLQGNLEAAVHAGPYARKRVLALTRRANNKRGRTVRWGDGADPTSTVYGT
jgi:hypothetical protein